MVSLAIGAFEGMRVRFALFGFKTRQVCLFVGFAIPTEFVVVLRFVGTITFDAL